MSAALPADLHPAVRALTEVLPGWGVDEEVDWPALEAAWETRFPSDYMAFMAVYGSGAIADSIGVVDPSTPDETRRGMTDETGNARLTWEMEGSQTGIPERAEDILAWGATSGADILCWLTTDSDPDKWPVVVWGRGTTPNWIVYECGMVEFLRRVATEEFKDLPDGEFPFNVYIYEEDLGAGPMVFESERDKNRERWLRTRGQA